MRSPLVPLSVCLFLVHGVAAQAAVYEVFSHGCAGTGADPVVCGAHNATGGTSSLTALPNEYCYHHKAAAAARVIGIRLWTNTFAANSEQVIRIGLYRVIGGAPRQTMTTSGTMLVGDKPGFYTGYFAQPVDLAQGEEFWVSQFDSTLVRAAGLDTGTAATGKTYWRPGAGGTGPWGETAIVKNPSYQILCEGTGRGRGAPVLMHSGVPKLGGSMDVILTQAPPLPTNLIVGIQSPDLLLTLIGGTGCRWLASLDIIVPVGTPVNGTLSFKMPFTDPVLFKGLVFYNQFYIFDPGANALGVTFSNGGRGLVGD